MSLRAGHRDSGSGVAKTNDIEYSEHCKEPVETLQERGKDDELLTPERRPAAERQLVRKLDMRLLPTIIVIFIMNYIDVSTAYDLFAHAIALTDGRGGVAW